MPKGRPSALRTLSLPFVPIAGKKQQRTKLLRLIFLNWLSNYLRNRIRYVPRTSHTNTFGTVEWFAQKAVPGGAIALAVGDESGEYRLSEIAGRHWLSIALSAIAEERKDFARWSTLFGYEMKRLTAVSTMLAPQKNPLVEVPFATPGYSRKPWLVAAVKNRPGMLIGDVGVGPSAMGDLDAMGRAAVARVAKSGLCECFLCQGIRQKQAKRAARRR